MKHRVCTHCGQSKLISEYYKKSNKPGEHLTKCKTCIKSINSKYRRTREGFLTKIFADQIKSSKRRKMKPPLYSKVELGEWLSKNAIFEELWNNWITSDFNTKLTPSVDRLDDYKPYSLDNIQLMTWSENNAKVHADIKAGINRKRSRGVIQYTPCGYPLAIYYSIRYAERVVGVSNLNRAADITDSKFRQAGGFIWRYVEDVCGLPSRKDKYSDDYVMKRIVDTLRRY